MISDRDLLAQVRIASPCDASWDEMEGDEFVRHCCQCRLNVYNLSVLSPRDAARLLREKEGRLCVRFYRRRDGTILTDNCPVGLRKVRRLLLKHLAAAFAIDGLLGALRPFFLRAWEAVSPRPAMGGPPAAGAGYGPPGSLAPLPVEGAVRMGKFAVPMGRTAPMGDLRTVRVAPPVPVRPYRRRSRGRRPRRARRRS